MTEAKTSIPAEVGTVIRIAESEASLSVDESRADDCDIVTVTYKDDTSAYAADKIMQELIRHHGFQLSCTFGDTEVFKVFQK